MNLNSFERAPRRLEENRDLYHNFLLTYFSGIEVGRAVRLVVSFGPREAAHLRMLDRETPMLACLSAFHRHYLRLAQGEP